MKTLTILTAIAAASALSASGITLNYNMNAEFSGGTAPAGPAPWVTLSLTDVAQPAGTVKLTINNVGLLGSENNDETSINYNDLLDLTTISVSLGTKVGTFDNPTVSLSENAFKADGDGFFDILIDFAQGGNLAKTFGANESLVLFFTDSDGSLSPTDFQFLSLDAGGHGPFAGAAHIQNTPNGGSGWIAGPVGGPFINPTVIIPTPDAGSTLVLLGGGLVGLGFAGRRLRR